MVEKRLIGDHLGLVGFGAVRERILVGPGAVFKDRDRVIAAVQNHRIVAHGDDLKPLCERDLLSVNRHIINSGIDRDRMPGRVFHRGVNDRLRRCVRERDGSVGPDLRPVNRLLQSHKIGLNGLTAERVDFGKRRAAALHKDIVKQSVHDNLFFPIIDDALIVFFLGRVRELECVRAVPMIHHAEIFVSEPERGDVKALHLVRSDIDAGRIFGVNDQLIIDFIIQGDGVVIGITVKLLGIIRRRIYVLAAVFIADCFDFLDKPLHGAHVYLVSAVLIAHHKVVFLNLKASRGLVDGRHLVQRIEPRQIITDHPVGMAVEIDRVEAGNFQRDFAVAHEDTLTGLEDIIILGRHHHAVQVFGLALEVLHGHHAFFIGIARDVEIGLRAVPIRILFAFARFLV